MSDESFDDVLPRYTAQLPSATLEAEQEYPRGTILNLNVQVRVIGFTENEDKKGNLIHKHNLALEEVSIIDFLTPAQRKALIEAAEREAEEQARLLAGGTITEEQHIEDVLPGQTTLEEQIEAQAQEAGRAEFERLRAENWANDDARGYAAQGAYHETKERLTREAEGDSYSPFDREDPRNHVQPGDLENTKLDYVPTDVVPGDREVPGGDLEWDGGDEIQFAHGKEPVSDYEPSATHPDGEDDDPEHDWMDEEEEFAHGVRVEVGF